MFVDHERVAAPEHVSGDRTRRGRIEDEPGAGESGGPCDRLVRHLELADHDVGLGDQPILVVVMFLPRPVGAGHHDDRVVLVGDVDECRTALRARDSAQVQAADTECLEAAPQDAGVEVITHPPDKLDLGAGESGRDSLVGTLSADVAPEAIGDDRLPWHGKVRQLGDRVEIDRPEHHDGWPTGLTRHRRSSR
jgi:hypothetical protein